MKLYLLEQDINRGYDIYDSCVVCAYDENDAKNIHPSEFVTHVKDDKWMGTYSGGSDIGGEYETENDFYRSWVRRDELGSIKVKYLGIASKEINRGVVCSSFNAG